MTRSCSTTSASRANRSTASSSSRPSRLAASSRAVRIVSVELLGRRLRVACGRALDDASEGLDLPTLDVAQRPLDSLRRLVALALDDLLQIPLAMPHPVGELLQRAPPLAGVLLELRRGGLQDVVREPDLLFAKPGDARALLVDLRVLCLGLLADPRLDVGDQLPLLRLELLDLDGQPFLELLDVGGPLREALLDRALGAEELLAQLGGRLALALRHIAPPLLGDPALLLGVAREGVGAQACQRALELL